MAGDETKEYAIKVENEYYELLGVNEAVAIDEIRRAYRKTALKYHPDKVGANEEAAQKFHLLQIAYDVLSDVDARALYDNARRARADREAREAAQSETTRHFAEKLKAKEAAHVKRKLGEDAADAELERILKTNQRIAQEFKERRAKETAEVAEKIRQISTQRQDSAPKPGISDARMVKLRYCKDDRQDEFTEDALKSLFGRFGPIELLVTREMKIKVEGKKRRRVFVMVVLYFESILGAQALMNNFANVKANEPEQFNVFEEVDWSRGQLPDGISQKAQDPSNHKRPPDNTSAPASWRDSIARLKRIQQQKEQERGAAETEAAKE